MSAANNSTLSLYSPCPPGLGGAGCTSATCNSTFVPPAQRTTKATDQTACSTCTSGFGGLNCNICQNSASCGVAAAAVGARTLNDDALTCYKQPRPISTTYLQCDVNQPTLKSIYPNRSIQITMAKVVEPDNSTLTGLASWPGQANTTLSQIWLDGVLQYYCQASGCSSQNSTNVIDPTNASLGSDIWTCDNLKCTCLSNATMCTGAGGGLAMSGIVNSLSGQLSMPCDYMMANGSMTAQCQFKGGQLTTYLGPAGLPLSNCTFGSCVTQSQMRAFELQNASAASDGNGGSHLSGPVIGGIVAVCVVIALLALVMLCGAFSRRRSARRVRHPTSTAAPIGLAWEDVSYKPKNGLSHRGFAGALLIRSSNKGSSPSLSGTDGATETGVAEKGSTSRNDGALERQYPMMEILKQISGSAPPGELLAILGPSGAGKTTLVELLAGKEKTGKMKGDIMATAREADYSTDDLTGAINDPLSERRLLAFVDQEDQLPAFSTVREALQFAADLSLPENVPEEEKRGIVQGVITTLGLQAVSESLIGSRGHRGISGGEKRRVSIGIALVAQPRILVLDEPLSGLDAYNALRVTNALRSLASKGPGSTTVIMTLHQPSSTIFHSLDRAIVLAVGSVLYDGTPDEALAWCDRRGSPCPLGHNVADHLLELAFSKSLSEDSAGQSRDAIAAQGPLNQVQLSRKHPGRDGSTTTTWFTQFSTLTRRYYRTALRDTAGPLSHLIGHIILGLVVGGAFFKVKFTIGGFQNRIGSLYFLFMLMLFATMTAMTFLNSVRPLMVRERSGGLYSPWSWLVAHGLYDVLCLRLIPGLFLEIILYWMIGLKPTARYFFEFLLVANVFYLDVALYMMMLGALFEDLSISILMGASFVLLNIGFGGFLLNLSTIPAPLRWIQWITPVKYALEAITQNEVEGLQVEDTLGAVSVNVSASLIAPGLFSLTGSYYRDLIVLALAFTLGYTALLAISVWWRMRDRR